MSENINKSSTRPHAGRLHFRDLSPATGLFQALLPLCEVWSGAPGRKSSQLLGTIQRTYRNSQHYVPGEPVWIFRDEKNGQLLESRHSEADLRKRIVAWFQAEPVPPPLPSTHRIWDAAVLFVGLPDGTGEQDQAKLRVREILDRHFEGYTIAPAHGCFRGESEPSLAVFLTPETAAQLSDVASEIRAALGEDGVGMYIQGRYVRVTKEAQGVVQ